jgi:hypothetical protein
MKPVMLLMLAGIAAAAQTDEFTNQLAEAARVASVMVDGDVCQRIVTPRALEYMFRQDPRDRWVDADNYDVDDQSFTSVKKTLIRVTRLISFPADANLWMPIPGHPDRIQVVIRQVNEMSQFWPWAALQQPMIPEMKSVLDSGRILTVSKKPGWVSVLAPVSDSVGDVVGVIEVASQRNRDPHENVK